MEHTKTPWTIEEVKDSDGGYVYARIGPQGRGSIAYSGVYGPNKSNAKLSEGEAQANAAFIVLACNAHDELMRTGLLILEAFDNDAHRSKAGESPTFFNGEDSAITAFRSAIAKAKPDAQ